MTLQLRYAAHSEIGLVRKNNQDSGYASPRLLVVADGMGGAAAGDLASAVAIQQLRRADRGGDAAPVRGEEMLELLAGALHNANEKIADLVADDHTLEGMGTTVTGAMFDGDQLGLVHIGDSRAYLQRGDDIIRLTHDHSWVQSLVDEGKLTAEEAAYHPHRSLLLKVLNGQPQADPDTALIDLAPGDRLLLCSDGLCGLVEDDELSRALVGDDDLQNVLDVLIDAAHREGGVDNITIILADVLEAGAEPPAAHTEDREAAVPNADDETAAHGVAPPGGGPPSDSETLGAAHPAEARAAHFQQDPKVVGAALDRTIPVVPPRGDDEPTIRRDRAELAGLATAGGDPPPGLASSPDEEEEEKIRYAPRLRTGRPRLLRAIIVVALVAALVGTALGAGYAWSRTQYYVGPAGENVAIHRGLAETVLGVPLSEVYEVQDIRIADLPPYYRDRVLRTIPVHTLDEARETSSQLKAVADRCIEQRRARAEAKPTPAPAPTPTGQPAPPGEPLSSTEPTLTMVPATPAPAPDPSEVC